AVSSVVLINWALVLFWPPWVKTAVIDRNALNAMNAERKSGRRICRRPPSIPASSPTCAVRRRVVKEPGRLPRTKSSTNTMTTRTLSQDKWRNREKARAA
ncbi:hypothetical protein E4U13_006109, partial [Claviceps humidiphila]